MEKDLFRDWFIKIFIPNCGRSRPILLLLDNHDSHYSYEVLKLAKENEVRLEYWKQGIKLRSIKKCSGCSKPKSVL